MKKNKGSVDDFSDVISAGGERQLRVLSHRECPSTTSFVNTSLLIGRRDLPFFFLLRLFGRAFDAA